MLTIHIQELHQKVGLLSTSEKASVRKSFASSAYTWIQTNHSHTKSPCQVKFKVPGADLVTVGFQQTDERDAQFHRAVMGKLKKFHRFIW